MTQSTSDRRPAPGTAAGRAGGSQVRRRSIRAQRRRRGRAPCAHGQTRRGLAVRICKARAPEAQTKTEGSVGKPELHALLELHSED